MHQMHSTCNSQKKRDRNKQERNRKNEETNSKKYNKREKANGRHWNRTEGANYLWYWTDAHHDDGHTIPICLSFE